MTEKDRNPDKSEYQRGEKRDDEHETERDGDTKTAEREHAAAQDMNPIVARDCVPMFEEEGAVKPSPDDLLEQMKGAVGLVEVAPSDGAKEILGAALLVTGDNPWRHIAQGLKLETGQDWLVHGPGLADLAKQATSILGYGLFLSGTQIAWSRRPEELRLGAGMTLNLKDDVIF